MENKTLSEALKNIKASEFRWQDLEEKIDNVEDTDVDIEEMTDALTYAGLGGGGGGANGNITIGTFTNSGSYLYSTGASNSVFTTTSPFITTAGSHGKSSLEVTGDIVMNGKSIGKVLEKIEDRLAILMEPSPEKLEKFAALKKAYEQYKLLEKLIGEE